MAIVSYEARPYKIILLGELGVGKTTLFLRVKSKAFVDTKDVTTRHGYDECLLNYTVDETPVRAKLYDTGGTERFKSLTHNYYRGADAVILCYSVDEPVSFQKLYDWHEMACRMMRGSEDDELIWAIVGNKSDFYSEVTPSEVDLFSSKVRTNLTFVVSSKTGDNIDTMLETVIKAICNKRRRLTVSEPQLGEGTEKTNSRCC